MGGILGGGIFEGLVIKFLVHELAVYGVGLDWTKLKVDFDAKISAMLPRFWAAEAEKVCNALLDAAQAAARDEVGWQTVIEALLAQDYAGAEKALLALLGKLPGGIFMLQVLGAA